MLIKTVFDIQTKQIGYAVCNAEHRCGFVTYSITNAIKAAQCKDFNQVQQLINAWNESNVSSLLSDSIQWLWVEKSIL